jgi:hypothetical protein
MQANRTDINRIGKNAFPEKQIRIGLKFLFADFAGETGVISCQSIAANRLRSV